MASVRSTENPSRSNLTSRETGAAGERLAASYLEKKGYTIAERNYRCIFGEIDLIARDGSTIVFIEVKSRRSKEFGDPESSVGRTKQIKLSKIALAYLNERNFENQSARFDVIAILMQRNGNEIRHIQNAFDLAF